MERASLWAEQAMARIAAEGLLPTPPQFALWYTYYSQHEPDLNREIDHLSAIGKPLTPACLDALWERFIGFSRERQVVRDTGERIQGALEQLAGSAALSRGRRQPICHRLAAVQRAP